MLPPKPNVFSHQRRLLEFRGAGQLLVISSDEPADFRHAVDFAMWWPAEIVDLGDLDDLLDTFSALHVHGDIDFGILEALAWEGIAIIPAEKVTPRTVAKRLGLDYERTQETQGSAWLKMLSDSELGGYVGQGYHELLYEIVRSPNYEKLIPLLDNKKPRLAENILDSLDI